MKIPQRNAEVAKELRGCGEMQKLTRIEEAEEECRCRRGVHRFDKNAKAGVECRGRVECRGWGETKSSGKI
jgi:hypothetical protein